MSPSAIRRRFGQLGFDIISGRRHDFAVKGKKKVPLPNPHGADVSVGLISRMLRDAEIDRNTWLNG